MGDAYWREFLIYKSIIWVGRNALQLASKTKGRAYKARPL